MKLMGMCKSNMIIMGLTGIAQSGKDTIANYLVEKYRFTKYSLADNVRNHLLLINPMITVDLKQMKELGITATKSLFYGFTFGKEIVVFRLSDLVECIGWDKAKQIPEVRELLQRDGTDAGRNFFGENVWSNKLIDFIKKEKIRDFYSKTESRIVVPDIRFDNEALACNFYGNAIIVKVINDRVVKVNDHVSENGISEELIDECIMNNGSLDDLYSNVSNLMQEEYNIKYKYIGA